MSRSASGDTSTRSDVAIGGEEGTLAEGLAGGEVCDRGEGGEGFADAEEEASAPRLQRYWPWSWSRHWFGQGRGLRGPRGGRLRRSGPVFGGVVGQALEETPGRR